MNELDQPTPDIQVSALIAIYETERQDLTSLMGHALTLVGLLIAYAAAASGLLSNDNSVFGEWFFAAIAAFPAWITLGFHANLMVLVFAHGNSAIFLEDKLSMIAGIAPDERDFVGAKAGEVATNIATQSVGARGQTLVTYVGIAALIISFTIYCISIVADRSGGWGSTESIATICFYGLLVLASAIAWAGILRENSQNTLAAKR